MKKVLAKLSVMLFVLLMAIPSVNASDIGLRKNIIIDEGHYISTPELRVRDVLKLDQNIEVLSGNKTLVVTDKTVQRLDPGGTSRNVTLPAEASSTDILFWIYNESNGAGEDLVIKNDATTTIITLGPGMGMEFICDGTNWIVFGDLGFEYDGVAGTHSSPTFVTVDLTGVTDTYIPYMKGSAAGFDESPLSTDGTDITTAGDIFANDAAGPAFMNEAATTTNPTLVPDRAEDDTGIGWASDTLHFVLGGVDEYSFSASTFDLNANTITEAGTITANDAAGPAIANEAATTTNPTLIPDKAEMDTGIGWASDTLHMVLGGADEYSFSASEATFKAILTVNPDGTNEVMQVNDGSIDFSDGNAGTKGTLTLDASGNWSYNKNIASTGNIEGATLTESGNAVPNVTDNLSVFAPTTSAQLKGVLNDETGSGLAVFATSPVFTTDIRPSGDGATDIGTTALGFGDTFIADDKKIYLGSDQDFSMEYDEDGNDSASFDGADINFNATAGVSQFGTASGVGQVNITPTTAIDALFIKTQEAAGATDGIKITDSGDVEIFAVDSDGNVEATSFTADHMVVSTKTDSHVVTSADFGKSLRMNSADDKSFTLPSVGTSEDGARVTFIKQGAGKMTMIAVDTDYIDDSSATGTIYTITNYATITLEYVHGMTRWVIISAAGTFTSS